MRSKGALVAQLAAHDGLIPLTIPEVRRLVYRLVVRVQASPDMVLPRTALVALASPPPGPRHQARAMCSHYRRRRFASTVRRST